MRTKVLFFILMGPCVMFGMSCQVLNYALLQAAQEGDELRARSLLAQNADPLATPSRLAQHRTPLMEAISYGKYGVAGILITQKLEQQVQSRDDQRYTLAHYIAAMHCIELLPFLKQANADFNDQDNITGESPLMRAIDTKAANNESKIKMIRQLLALGADPTLKNRNGSNAFALAERQPAEIKHRILGLLLNRPEDHSHIHAH
jgi:ankyrin repeat protein